MSKVTESLENLFDKEYEAYNDLEDDDQLSRLERVHALWLETKKMETEEKSTEKDWFEWGKDVAGVVVPAGVFVFLTMLGFEYEKNDNISFSGLRNLLGKMSPKK